MSSVPSDAPVDQVEGPEAELAELGVAFAGVLDLLSE
eukprot:XP_001710277.1 Hypothetical protein GL50803_33687 [Giardia lamblia ATCC 50803]